MPSRRKRIKARVRLRQSDVWRTVLTDTAPFEVPIIFSNDGFYKNLSEYDIKSDKLQKLIDAIVLAPRDCTIPWRYNIVRSAAGVRTLSLLHPHGQVDLAHFYQRYDQLICEYGRRSPLSIRKPEKVGTSFYFRSEISERNKYRRTSVNVDQIDRLLRNPESYFSYAGYNKLYRFFKSSEYVVLEKRFKFQLSLDVSKCFDSIYTHSIAWAVKDKRVAKNYKNAHSFGNQFDSTMRRLNHNETSGICIGPEASRIFAEIILARVDESVLRELENADGLVHGRDFECRRYIDNYYVFANAESILLKVQREIANALREYKLHLNDGKTEQRDRPFYSSKSLVIDNVNQSIQKLWNQTMHDTRPMELIFPRRIFRHEAVFGKFTREVKAACFSAGLGYDAAANYVVGAVKRWLVELVDTYEEARKADPQRSELIHYRQNMMLLLDIGFYFFTLHPTVASSLKLGHAIVRAAQHMSRRDSQGFEILKELTFRWTTELVRSPVVSGLQARNSVVPVEVLNVLVSVQQFDVDGELAKQILDSTQLDSGQDWYFQVVVIIYMCRRYGILEDKKNQVFRQAQQRLVNSSELSKDSELAHMLLDLLACPFIDASEREGLLKTVWPTLRHKHSGLGNISNKVASQLVSEIEQKHWFVRWEGVDLLNMIERKELSAVYA